MQKLADTVYSCAHKFYEDLIYSSQFNTLSSVLCLGEYTMPQHMRLIQTNYSLLSHRMDLDGGLLSELYSKDVITHREMETIKTGRTSYDRNEELLNVMLRKTDVKFREFVVKVRACNMAHLAEMLEIDS